MPWASSTLLAANNYKDGRGLRTAGEMNMVGKDKIRRPLFYVHKTLLNTIINLSSKKKKKQEQGVRNELSYIVGCMGFFLGLPGFAYRLLICAAVLCSSRFSSCSFGLHTWQIHIPGGSQATKKEGGEQRRKRTRTAF